MGWASGGDLARRLVTSALTNIVSDRERKSFYLDLIDAFEDDDWDTQDEALGIDPVFDEAMQQLHSDWETWDADGEDDYADDDWLLEADPSDL